jgi:uncharacterized protein (DUF433 family)
MLGIIRAIPNNEEVESETNEPVYGYEIPTWKMSDTITRDIVSCLTYTRQRGEATEPYSLPTEVWFSSAVGRPLLSQTIGNEVVRYVGTCGARLEIGAVSTYVTEEWPSIITSGGDISEDTIEQRVAFEDILNKVLGPNIVISRAKLPKPSFETYIEWIDKPGYRSEPVVKGKGIPVWAIAAYVLDLDLSYEEVVSDWEGEISVDEVKAAMEYYQAHPEEVEEKRRWASPR